MFPSKPINPRLAASPPAYAMLDTPAMEVGSPSAEASPNPSPPPYDCRWLEDLGIGDLAATEELHEFTKAFLQAQPAPLQAVSSLTSTAASASSAAPSPPPSEDWASPLMSSAVVDTTEWDAMLSELFASSPEALVAAAAAAAASATVSEPGTSLEADPVAPASVASDPLSADLLHTDRGPWRGRA